MIRDIVLPQLSMGMSEGTIVEWMVKEGDRVAREQPFVAIETEKVVTELPAPYGGYIHLLAKPGETLSVDALVARIAESEEEYRSLDADVPAAAPGVAASPVEAPASAAAARPGGHADVLRAGATRQPASGLARAIAREEGIDLATVPGSGPGGRIVRRDVNAAIERRTRVAKAEVPGGPREKARIPLAGTRAAIAEKVTAAASAAHTCLYFEVDVTRLLEARTTLLGHEAALGTRVSPVAFYARALALACREVPVCNATLAGGEVVVWDDVNVGIAVALSGRGPYDSAVVVPVVRDVQDQGVLQIDRAVKELVRKARAGGLSAADTAGGTITLSSTDGFLPGGWMMSAPLLNLPQVVGFQPGTPIEKPVVVDGQIVVRTMLPCGLTYDHRATDGEPVGRFVRKLRDLLATPELLMF